MLVDVQSFKGGTGKSLVARFAVNHFIAKDRPCDKEPLLIDMDASNPDVATSYLDIFGYGKRCEVKIYDIEDDNDFRRLVKIICEANEKGRDIIINRRPGNQNEVKKYGPALADLCARASIDFVTLWVMALEPVCVDQLITFINFMGAGTRISLIKNFDFLKNNEKYAPFDYFENSKLTQSFPSVSFPFLERELVNKLGILECQAVFEITDVKFKKTIELAETAIANAIQNARRWKKS